MAFSDLEVPVRDSGQLAAVERENGESEPEPGLMRKVFDRVQPTRLLAAVLGVGLFVVAWELVAWHDKFLIPTVSAIVSSLVHDSHLYWMNLLTTLREMVVGLVVSFVIAFGLAVLMCHAKAVEWAVMPLAVMLQVTPIIGITPGLVIAFGFGSLPKYIITAMIVFFPLLINSLIGLRSADPATLDLLQTLHASRLEVLWKLRLPSSLPFLFAAFRICLPLALIGAVVAEFLAAGQARGLGSLIEVAQGEGNLVVIYTSTLVLAIAGLAVTAGVVALERSVLSWHPSSQRS